MRNAIIIDALTSVDIVEKVKCGGNVLKDFSVKAWKIILIRNSLMICFKKKTELFKSQVKDSLTYKTKLKKIGNLQTNIIKCFLII